MDISIRKISNFTPRDPEVKSSQAIDRDRFDFSSHDDPNDTPRKKKGKISLLSYDFVKYRKRVGAKLRPKEKLGHAPSYFKKYSNFASAFLVETAYHEAKTRQYQCIFSHSKLPSPLESDQTMQHQSLLDNLAYHRSVVADSKLSQICDAYTVDDVIGFDLFGINLDLDEAILHYKAFELLGREYARARLLKEEALHQSKSEEQKHLAYRAFERTSEELNDEFLAYRF